MKDTEVELKFPLKNPQELTKKLNASAQIRKQNQYQKDIYYIPAHRNFLDKDPISEWLRVRETKDKQALNYKNWHHKPGKETVSCDEFETTIYNISAFKEILKRLNFSEIIKVEKTRNTWLLDSVEIAIDNVTGLGSFIELEAKGQFNSIEEAKQQLYTILKQLNADIGEQDFKGYPHRLIEKNKSHTSEPQP